MPIDQTELYGTAQATLPTRRADGGAEDAVRLGTYGEIYTRPVGSGKMSAQAEEGSYFVLRNATPATGLAGHAAATTLDDTKAFLLIKNTHATKCIYLDFIKTEVTAAGTGGTNLRYAMKLDNTATRYSSGGTALTAVNPNGNSSETGSITAYAGAVVCAAAGSEARLVDHGLVRTVINVIGDRYTFAFGSTAQAGSGMVLEGTAQANVVIGCPPVVIAPGMNFLFHFFSASQSAASSHEIVVGLTQR